MQPINNRLIRIKNDYCKNPDASTFIVIIPWHIKVMYIYYISGEEVFSGSDRILNPYNLKSYHPENY